MQRQELELLFKNATRTEILCNPEMDSEPFWTPFKKRTGSFEIGVVIVNASQ